MPLTLRICLSVVAGIWICGGLATVYQVGRPREPLSPAVAVVSVAITAFAVATVMIAAVR